MTTSFVNGRFKVELSENVAIQKVKRAELAAKVQKTALIILFSVGIMAASIAGEVSLAILLSALAKVVIFDKEEKTDPKPYKNPIDKPYLKLLELMIERHSMELSFIES